MYGILAFSVQQRANWVTWYRAANYITPNQRNHSITHSGSPYFRKYILRLRQVFEKHEPCGNSTIEFGDLQGQVQM